MTAITTFLPTMVPQSTTIGLADQKPLRFADHLGLSVIDRLVADLLLYHRDPHPSLEPGGASRPGQRPHVGQPKAGAGHLAGIPSGQRYYQIISVDAQISLTIPRIRRPAVCNSVQNNTQCAFVRGRNYVLASPALAQAHPYGGCCWPDRDQSAHSGVKTRFVCSKPYTTIIFTTTDAERPKNPMGTPEFR